MRLQMNRSGIALGRVMVILIAPAAGFCQPTRVAKSETPPTTVHTDQSNTFVAGNQNFGSAASFRMKAGTGVPPTVDCDSSPEVGRVYVRTDAAGPSGSLYVCSNIGAGVYGWELAQGSGVTWRNNGALVGTKPTVNVIAGQGFNAITTDSGAAIDLTINADTAVLATVDNDVNFTGKKSFNTTSGKAGLRTAPSNAPSSLLAAGDQYFDATTNTPYWYDGASWKQGAFAAAILTNGAPLIGNGANQIRTGATTGTGNFVLASAPTISNPVITSFINATHTHADDANGGVLPLLQGADTIASAGTITPGSSTVFHVTGTTNISSMNSCDSARAGRRVTLIFDGALTFTDGGNLKLAGNFVTTGEDTISLVCDGSNWYETSRSVN